MTRPINLLVIHCSTTPSGQSIEKGSPGQLAFMNAAQVINAWHAVRGFKRGATARQGFNANSLGIFLVGSLEREGRYTLAQRQALAETTNGLTATQKLRR